MADKDMSHYREKYVAYIYGKYLVKVGFKTGLSGFFFYWFCLVWEFIMKNINNIKIKFISEGVNYCFSSWSGVILCRSIRSLTWTISIILILSLVAIM